MINKILRLFANTLTVDDKHDLLNRDHLTQPIQMQLYQKQKTFSGFLFAFSKSILNFTHLQKKIPLIADVFGKSRFRKFCLDKCVKSRVLEDP